MRLDTEEGDGNNHRRIVLKQPWHLCSIFGPGLPHIPCLVKRLDTTSWAFLDLHTSTLILLAKLFKVQIEHSGFGCE